MKVRRSFRIRLALSMAAVLAVALCVTAVAHAHEGRPVGGYEFVVGFLAEPALEGVKNGVDLRVRVPAEAAGGEPTPVDGLEETLQVELTHVPSGVSKVMALRGIFGEPGHYTADLIPTAPGQYRFRIFGSVEGTAIDEVFESGPGRFGDVEPAGEIQFPEQLPTTREVVSGARGALDAAQQAEDNAAGANSLAIAGVVLGVIGTLSGLGALALGRRGR